MIKHGICLVALGYPLYGNTAFNLALGLKAYDPKVPITLIHDESAISELTDQEKKFFNTFILLPKEEFIINDKPQYPRAKLLIYKYSPYDFTIYMDVDNIMHPDRKASHLFGEMLNQDFCIGMNGFYDPKKQSRTNQGYTYWGEPEDICKYHKLTNPLPQTISGFFCFQKGEYAQKVFDLALQIYDEKGTPNVPWAGGKPDEYCFNVALSMLNHKPENRHIFYFDKVNGTMLTKELILINFWGIAIGGNKVQPRIIDLYNRLVNKYCTRMNVMTRKYHVDKCKVINERKIY